MGIELVPVDAQADQIDKAMYNLEVSFRTQFDFNHTTKVPFIKPSHLYKINY
jgi:hypothetical protein